jgi:hypothetical protein
MEEIDLANSKLTPDNEIYLISIVEGIRENYPGVDLDEEMCEMGYSLEDLTDRSKIVSFMKRLNEKYPD